MGANRTNTEQFQLRLPPGLRERIKAYAELQGRSTNAEIVRILDREFPEPENIEGRISQLLDLVVLLKGSTVEGPIGRLTDELVTTVRAISDGTIQGVDEKVRNRIQARLERWEEDFAETESQYAEEGLDEIEIDALSQGRSTAKYPMDREWRRKARMMSGRKFTEAEEDAFRLGWEAAKDGRARSTLGDLDEGEGE